MTHQRSVLLAITAVLAAACGGPVGLDDITVRADRDRYTIGDEAHVLVTNNGGESMWLKTGASCAPALERSVDGEWEPIECVGLLRLDLTEVHPGETRSLPFAISDDTVTAGSTYRFVAHVFPERSGNGFTIPTQPFRVEATTEQFDRERSDEPERLEPAS